MNEPLMISEEFQSIREGMLADGFDLFVTELSAERAVVCLEAKDPDCLDCLVPDAILQQIVETAIREAEPSVTRVKIVKKGFEAAQHG